jgi:DNA repair protein RadD
MEDRYYQTEGVNAFFNYFINGGRGNPLLAYPTGTGKSVIIARIIQAALQTYSNTRIIVGTHVKELIAQNADKLLTVWPNAPVSIYSAGLKQKDYTGQVVFGGIASMINRAQDFGHRDLMLIDEAHLLSPSGDSMYQRFISYLRNINPKLKTVGFTATPYRIGQGLLIDDGLFTDLIIDYTNFENFNRLLHDGYLVPPIPKKTKTILSVDGVGMSNGDYSQNQLQNAVDLQDINLSACNEMVQYGTNRRAWLVFCSGVEHAEHVASILRMMGIPTQAVHSKLEAGKRDEYIKQFKSGQLRCLCNNNVLTTGFDYPEIDLIGMLRPTMSTGLWVQMLGRGTRPAIWVGKLNCLVLDFAGNTARLGPINDPIIPKKRGPSSGEAPVKLCENCGTYNHLRAKICIECGAEFTFEVKITHQASTLELVKTDLPEIETFEIARVLYRAVNRNNGKPPVLLITYITRDLRQFKDVKCFEDEGPALHYAHVWWREHSGKQECPSTTNDAQQYAKYLKIPERIRVWTNKKPNAEVLSREGLHFMQ